MDWFTVDKQGLAKLLEKRGKAFALFELIQNCWDTNAKHVRVTVWPIPTKPYAEVFVEDDDPDGFSDLAHAFTLFAESTKKSNPSKRGRFNLGEKLVLALCVEAQISSTTGTVTFDERGRTEHRQRRTESGSIFKGTMRMTREEFREAEQALLTLLPPDGVETQFNGVLLKPREVVKSFEETLPTERADEEGILRPTRRKTTVTLHEVRPGETAMLYEMGIPIVELSGGEKWHVNVQQKIPLNVDRDNVTPRYLRELRTYVLNHTFDLLKGKDEATAAWVRDASADNRAVPQAVEKVIAERFGEKRVIYDPSDPEGTKLAISKGYTVIPAGALSKGEWANVKSSGAALPAGKVTPSPKPYSETGAPLKLIPIEDWTKPMERLALFAETLGRYLLGVTVVVQIANEPLWPHVATFGRSGVLTFNAGRLGKKWFEKEPTSTAVLSLLVHEFGHFSSLDHLSSEYHDALCDLGAKLALAALQRPELFHSA